MFKNWPPSKGSAMVRSNGMMLHLRGSGSSNVASRIPGPGMMIKAGTPIRFAIPMRPQKGNLAPSASNNVFYKAGYPQSSYKRPYAAHLTAQSPAAFKFSSPSQKTAIKLQVGQISRFLLTKCLITIHDSCRHHSKTSLNTFTRKFTCQNMLIPWDTMSDQMVRFTRFRRQTSAAKIMRKHQKLITTFWTTNSIQI